MSLFANAGDRRQYAILKNFFSFQVVDYMNVESARGDYAQNMPGVIRPRLNWGLDYLGRK
jgi:hypothetical protein